MCKGILDYDKRLEAYECKACVQWYDLRLQDTPLKDIRDFKLVPYAAQRHYPEFDSEDPNMPFVEAMDLNDTDKEMEGVEVRSYENGRMQHIKVKGSFSDAIKAGVLSTKKRDDDQ